MHRFQEKVRKSSVYKKSLVFFILLSAASILILSLAFYGLFTSYTLTNITHLSLDTLFSISYTSDIIYNQVQVLGSQMLVNQDIVNFMYTDELDTLKEYHARLSAKELQAPHPFINHISIYNGKINRFVNTGPIVKEANTALVEQIQSGPGRKYSAMDFFPRNVLVNTIERDVYSSFEVLTFVIYPVFGISNEELKALIINVDADYIINMVDSISRSGGGELLIINNEGVVLSSSEKDTFATNASGNDVVKKIIDENESSGSFIHDSGNGRQLITYVKSSKLDWYFIMSQDYSKIFSDIQTLRHVIILISLGLFLAAVILSLYFSKKLYFPLKKLTNAIENQLEIKHTNNISNEYEYLSEQISSYVDKSHLMEKSMSNALPLLRDAWLRMVLKGQPSHITDSGMLSDYIQSSLSSSAFCVVLAKTDKQNDPAGQAPFNLYELNKVEISEMLKNMLRVKCEYQIIFTAPDEMSLILLLKDEATLQGSMESLLEFQELLYEQKKLSLSFALGDIAYSTEQLQRSYQSAVEYIRYRIFMGARCIIEKSSIEAQMNNIIDYPSALENELLEAINPNLREKIPLIVDKFTEMCSKSTYQTFILYCNQLMLSVLRHFNTILDAVNTDSVYGDMMQQNLAFFSSADEIKTHIVKFCNEICTCIEYQFTTNRFDLVNEIKEIIEKHFSEEFFTINSVADELNYSPSYLNRLFKSVTGVGFSNYLNNIRLEKARQYLSTSIYTVSKIRRIVGFSNNGYFFTLFKKKYGLTPSQFRKMQ